MRHRLALLLLASGLTAGMVALDALWPTQAGRPLHRVRKPLSARRPPQERLFRGKPTSYWSRVVQAGGFRFGGWSHSVTIIDEGKDTFLPAWEPANQDLALLFVDLLGDEDPFVRQTAAHGLGPYHHPDAVPALIDALADEDADVRQWAARTLGSYSEPTVVPALIYALRDADEDVRWQAASSLLGKGQALPPRVKKVADAIWEKGKGKGVISFGTSGMTDEEMAEVRGMTNLRGLNLTGTAVTDAGLVNLSGLKKLSILRLSRTRVTDAGLAYLRGLRSLSLLDLSGTAVSDTGPAHLKGLARLRWLNVTDTGVTEAGARDLQQALPLLKIQR